MKESEIEKIIVKFLTREANFNELEKLNVWLKNDKNTPIFNQFVKTEYLIAICMGEYDVKKAKKAINYKLKSIERKRKATIFKRMSIAASILLILGLSLFQLNTEDEVIEEISTTIDIGSSKAVLTLENGNQVSLENGKKYHNGKVSSNGEKLVYGQKKETKELQEKPSYNYLTIPRGGKFFVQLADGTRVWLNSDSKLKYPIKFLEGRTRSVELIYGEAYFEVSPSTDHNGAPFNVLTKMQEVNVLGTEFNIKAYDDDDEIATTLVEGKIAVQKGGVKRVLRPNEQSKTDLGSDMIEVLEIDVLQEISWKDGMFTFNEESLDEMMKVISRWYDAEIIFESAERKQFVFTGILERTKSVEDILKLIEAAGEGEVKFEIDNKTIIIK
ncbi:Putative anti-sigma factor [hydrothermal vent metagenome]|uniref:Anti-sigma factor n=1 Tax=hydrothermal vent metagenome TaxID=652676 RepID=A0A3B0TNZ3_9ZZZZ